MDSSLKAIALPPRFQRAAALGRGGQKEVVLAFDTLLERNVAVSIYPRASEGSLGVWLRESRAMARVSNHGGIVTVYDILTTPDALLIVSEYVDGEDLETRLNRVARLTWSECRPIAAQLLDALAHIHANGVIHRDVKPSNVLLNRRGEVRLGDFGLSKGLDGSSLSATVLAGTPEYMSPEQISGAPVGTATDLYSFGCLVFRMLEGYTPFSGHTRGAVFAHLNVLPPKLKDSIGVPAVIGTLLTQLFQKDPGRRPDAATASLYFSDHSPSPLIPSRIQNSRIVGRSGEIEALAGSLLTDSGGAVALLRGEAGIGKSELAESLLERATSLGFACERTYCSDSAGAVPLWPWIDLAAKLRERPQFDRLWQHFRAGREAFAELVERGASGAELVARNEIGLKATQIYDSGARFFSLAAREQPLVMLLEDIQLADAAVITLLEQLVQRIRDLPLKLLVTERWHTGEFVGFSPHLHRLARWISIDEIDVPRLSDDASLNLALRVHPRLTRAQRDAVLRFAEGNPLYIKELARTYRFQKSLDDSYQVPASIRELIRARLPPTDSFGYRLLEFASVVDREFSLDILFKIAGDPMESIEAQLEELVRFRFLNRSRSGGGYSFAHALTREVIVEAMPPTRLRQLHLRAAEVLRDYETNEHGRMICALADHLMSSSAGFGSGRYCHDRHFGGRFCFRNCILREGSKVLPRGHRCGVAILR